MYKIKTVKNLNKFLLVQDGIVIQDKDGNITTNEIFLVKFVLQTEMLVFEKQVYIQDWEGNYFIGSLNGELIEKGTKKSFFNVNSNNLGIQYTKEGITYNGLIKKGNINPFFVIEFKKYSTNAALFENHFVLLENFKTLICFSLNDTKQEWVETISNLDVNSNETTETKIREISGNYNEKLLCTLNNGNILILNMNTGKVLKYWKDTLVSYWLTPKVEGNKIFWGLSHKTFVEIDAEKEELIKTIDLTEQLKAIKNVRAESPNYVFVSTSIVYNDLIYFIADRNVLGIFNPALEKISWWHQFEFEKRGVFLKGGKEGLQVNETGLYVLDSEGVLYIFKKEVTR